MTNDSITSSDAQKEEDQSIFELQFHALTDGFGEACEKHKVGLAFAIAMHPDQSNPIIFAKGHNYDIAVLLTKVLNSMKASLLSDLDLLD